MGIIHPDNCICDLCQRYAGAVSESPPTAGSALVDALQMCLHWAEHDLDLYTRNGAPMAMRESIAHRVKVIKDALAQNARRHGAELARLP